MVAIVTVILALLTLALGIVGLIQTASIAWTCAECVEILWALSIPLVCAGAGACGFIALGGALLRTLI